MTWGAFQKGQDRAIEFLGEIAKFTVSNAEITDEGVNALRSELITKSANFFYEGSNSLKTYLETTTKPANTPNEKYRPE